MQFGNSAAFQTADTVAWYTRCIHTGSYVYIHETMLTMTWQKVVGFIIPVSAWKDQNICTDLKKCTKLKKSLLESLAQDQRFLFNSFCREGRSDLQSQFLMRVNLVVCGKALILGFGRTPLTFKWHGRELMLKGTVTSYTRTHSIYIHIYIYRAPWHPTLEPILYVYIYLYIYIYIYTGYRDILH